MELLERERFLEELATILGHVVAGNGRTVLVSDEAGIGKTALVERFADQHRQTARILWGACEALLRIEMTEFAFRPAIIRLTPGRPSRLLFVNRGQIAHQFETAYLRGIAARIVDATMHVETSGVDFVRLGPGGSAKVEFLPSQKGRFPFACTIEGHREAGMHGILEVR